MEGLGKALERKKHLSHLFENENDFILGRGSSMTKSLKVNILIQGMTADGWRDG